MGIFALNVFSFSNVLKRMNDMLNYRLFFQYNAKPTTSEWIKTNPNSLRAIQTLPVKFISKHNFEDYFTRNQNTSLKLTEKFTEQSKLAESYDFDDYYEDIDKSEKY